jgi:hypothetical protein
MIQILFFIEFLNIFTIIMAFIGKINDIFKKCCSNKYINNISKIKLRNNENKIQLNDVILYRFKYSELDKTKLSILSNINFNNNKIFSRQAYYQKEKRIPLDFYSNLLNEIIILHQNVVQKDTTNLIHNKFKLVAVDGVCNNDTKSDIMYNLGIFDISNNVPINIIPDIKYDNHYNENSEIEKFITYIKEHHNECKRFIFVIDRLYYNYELINLLISKKLKFIIRIKGNGSALENGKMSKSNKNYKIFEKIKHNIRMIKCQYQAPKLLQKHKLNNNNNKDIKKVFMKQECNLVTNLISKNSYSDEDILKYYKSRWDIEVFFKFIKNKTKFQYMNENNINDNYKKNYICELILVYLSKLLELEIPKKENYKINKSNMLCGLYDELLKKIIDGNLTSENFSIFIRSYINYYKNDEDRHYPRISNRPYSKWYTKNYSETLNYIRIAEAIEDNTIELLTPELKILSEKISLDTG